MLRTRVAVLPSLVLAYQIHGIQGTVLENWQAVQPSDAGEPLRGEPLRGEPLRGEPLRGDPRGEPRGELRGERTRATSVGPAELGPFRLVSE